MKDPGDGGNIRTKVPHNHRVRTYFFAYTRSVPCHIERKKKLKGGAWHLWDEKGKKKRSDDRWRIDETNH